MRTTIRGLPMSYLHLLYRSIPAHTDFDPTDLDIQRNSAQANAALGITGYLWRTGSQFVQVLHGPEPAVDALMTKIESDPRHTDVELLMRRSAPEESPFSGWEMGYDHLLDIGSGLELDPTGLRVPLGQAEVSGIWDWLVNAAREAAEFGTAFSIAAAPDPAAPDRAEPAPRGDTPAPAKTAPK